MNRNAIGEETKERTLAKNAEQILESHDEE